MYDSRFETALEPSGRFTDDESIVAMASMADIFSLFTSGFIAIAVSPPRMSESLPASFTNDSDHAKCERVSAKEVF